MPRTPKPKILHNSSEHSSYSEGKTVKESGLTLIHGRPKLDHLLRSRCRLAFLIISLLAMLVVIRSGISASRGYALVETQNKAQYVEMENERLRIEIAKLKSPQRIKQIAADELGMGVPAKMYFSH